MNALLERGIAAERIKPLVTFLFPTKRRLHGQAANPTVGSEPLGRKARALIVLGNRPFNNTTGNTT